MLNIIIVLYTTNELLIVKKDLIINAYKLLENFSLFITKKNEITKSSTKVSNTTTYKLKV